MSAAAYGFSIIIPTYNRPPQLRECLEALAALDEPGQPFEVIVVDDGSPTHLDSVVEPFRQRLNLTLLRQANAGPAAARNTAVAQARGRFLAFTDDDCAPTRDWLVRLAAKLAQFPDCLVGGHTVNRLNDNAFSSASQAIVDVVYAHYNADPDDARFFASNNMALAIEHYRALGGFDARFRNAEDREFCDRWRHSGRRLVFEHEAVVNHAHPLSLRSFCRQHFGYGCGAWNYQCIRADRGSGTMRSEMSFHARLPRLLRPIFRGLSLRRKASLGALLLVWQFTNAAGYFWQRWRQRPIKAAGG